MADRYRHYGGESTAIVLRICSGLLPMSSGYAVYYCHCPQDMQWITAYAVDYCHCPQDMQWITANVLSICSVLLPLSSGYAVDYFEIVPVC